MVSKSRVQKCGCDAIAIHLLNKMWHGTSEPYPKLNQVRRNLFGFSGPNNESQLLDKRITDMAQKSSQEWNFDFVNEMPQTGKYVWQRVRCYDVPIWYAASNRIALKDAHCIQKDDESDVSECSSPLSNSKACTLFKTKEKESKKPRLVQTSMKDFTRVQKRRSSRRLRLKQLNKSRLQKHASNSVLEL